MNEDCVCELAKDLEHREPVFDEYGERALRCPGCGHLEYLRWLPEDVRLLILDDEFDAGSARYAGRPLTRCKPSVGSGPHKGYESPSSNNTARTGATPRAKE